jgi:Uma2 family endonuclease
MSIGAIYPEAPSERESVQKTMTAEEFMALPDDGIDRELIRGELREYGMTVRSRWHSRVEGRIAQYLNNWLDRQPEPRGELVCGEAGFRLGGTNESLVGIDVAIVSAELLASTPVNQAIFNGPPMIAIEILSSSDTLKRIAEKVNLYLEWGVTTWIVNPEFRTITIHRPGQEAVMYNRDDELPGDPELPGFQLRLSELFPA